MSEGRQKELNDGPQKWTEDDVKDAARLLARLGQRQGKASGGLQNTPEKILGEPSRRGNAAAQGAQLSIDFSRVTPAETRGEASAKRRNLPAETCCQAGVRGDWQQEH